MNRGPKRQYPSEEQARGTYQECRDKPLHLITDASEPVMPSYLPAAQTVWQEELKRVVKVGSGETDSSFFADYCRLISRYSLAAKVDKISPNPSTFDQLSSTLNLMRKVDVIN